jgi:WD40 repeat protein
MAVAIRLAALGREHSASGRPPVVAPGSRTWRGWPHRELSRILDLEIDRRTLARSLVFWQEEFPRTAFWKVARGFMQPLVEAASLPLELLRQFLHGRDSDPTPGWKGLLLFLSPIAWFQAHPTHAPMRSYSPVRRYMQAHGWLRKRRAAAKGRPGERPAAPRRERREIRSYEAEYVDSLWHLDFHHGSPPMRLPSDQWQRLLALGILDDCSRRGRRKSPRGGQVCCDDRHTVHQKSVLGASLRRDLPASLACCYHEQARIPVSTNRITTTDVRDGPMREKAQSVSAGIVAVMAAVAAGFRHFVGRLRGDRVQPFAIERAEALRPLADRWWFRGRGRLVAAVLFALAASGWAGCQPRAEPCGQRPAAVRFVQTGHVSNLRRAEFSGDGRWLLTVSVDGEAILWDARAGRPRRVLHEIGPVHQRVRQVVELSPDGSQSLLSRGDAELGRTELGLQPTATGKTLRVLKGSAGIAADDAAFSRDGRYVCAIVAGVQGLPFRVWDVRTGECIWSPEMPLPYDAERLEALQREIKSAGQQFDSTAADNAAYLWFLRQVRPDGRPLTFARPLRMYNWTDGFFSPDGRRFLTREEYDVGYDEATLWDVETGKPIKRFFGAYDEPSDRLFHPDGRSYLAGQGSENARLLSTEAGELIREFHGHKAEITCLAFAFDGRTLLSGDADGVVILWETASAKPLRTWPRHRGGAVSVAYRPDGKRVLFGCGKGLAVEYDLGAEKPRQSLESRGRGHAAQDVLAAYSPDGQRILTRSPVHGDSRSDWFAAMWDAETGQRIVTLGASPRQRLALSPQGDWAAGLAKPPLHLWNTHSGQRVHSFSRSATRSPPEAAGQFSNRVTATPVPMPKNAAARELRSAPNDSPRVPEPELEDLLATPGIDRDAIDWLTKPKGAVAEPPNEQTPTGIFIQRVLADGTRRDASFQTQAWSADARRIERWERGRVVVEFRADSLVPTAAVLTQDGSQLLVAYKEAFGNANRGRKTLIIWDTKSGQRLRTIDVTQPEMDASWTVNLLKLSPDDRYLALGYSYRVFLLDLETEHRFDMGRAGFYRASEPLVMFSPDSRRVFCCGYRHTLWDIEGRKQVADLGAYNGVERPAFSPNGKFLFATSSNPPAGAAGSILWDCEKGQQHRRVGDEGIRVLFSAAGDRLLAFHGNLKAAQLWDFNAGEPLSELTVPGGGSLLDVRLLPEEGRFLTLHGHALAVWDFGSGKMLHAHVDETLAFESRYDVQGVFLLSDQRRLITVHRTGAAVWEAAGGRLIHRLRTSGPRCTAALVGREPNTLLTVSPGGDAVLWDLESGQRRMVFGGVPADVFPAHREVWFSADGRRLFARHRAGQAVVAWDVGTGRIVRRYYLVNDGDDLLVEVPCTGKFLGSPSARTKVVTLSPVPPASG